MEPRGIDAPVRESSNPVKRVLNGGNVPGDLIAAAALFAASFVRREEEPAPVIRRATKAAGADAVRWKRYSGIGHTIWRTDAALAAPALYRRFAEGLPASGVLRSFAE